MKYYPLVLFFFIASCAAKNHGAYFNNQYDRYTAVHNTSLSISDSTFTASSDVKPLVFFEEESDEYVLSNDDLHHQKKVVSSEWEGKGESSAIIPVESIPIKDDIGEPKERVVEPLGVTSLALNILGLFALASGFPIALLFLIAALTLGIISLVKIKKSRQKWKGKRFATTSLLISGVLIILVGYIAYLFSIGAFI